MRDLSPDFSAIVSSAEITPAVLVFLDLEEGPLRIWTGLGTLEWGGESWQGIGSFGAVEPIEEYSDVRSGSVGLMLTGVPNRTLSTLKDIGFKDRGASIYLAMFAGDSRELIGVELMLRGTMDVLKLNRAPESSTLTLSIVNELSRLRDTWGSLYTDPHQQALFPGDTSLRFVASLQDLQIRI